MTDRRALRVLLVDPSLFTAPYDAALTGGLIEAGVSPIWVTRPTRKGDRQELPIERTDPFFYKRVDEATWLPARLKPLAKGAAHLAGLVALLRKIRANPPDVVHFQWTVVPPLDALAMALIRRWCPLVLTVHDTVPFNGERLSLLQNLGFDLPMRLAHRVIVHTDSGRQTLIARGIPPGKIATIPHGALQLQVPLPQRTERPDGRYSFVLFGEIKPYKGVDVLIEAVHRLPDEVRRQTRVVIAGRPRMNLAPLEERIASLGLADTIELRPQRQSEEAMAALFVEADSFVFPYRQIDASGVWFLTQSLGRWMIASRVGIFAADLVEGRQGVLVPPGDSAALAAAMEQAVRQRLTGDAMPASDQWIGIGHATRNVYDALLPQHSGAALVEARS
jgi:glycosyltransferase involved in cell wall biosynthesis